MADGYEAFWIPGLDSDIDQDEGIDIAQRWLDERKGKRIIVVNTLAMGRDFRQSGLVYSPLSRTSPPAGPKSVLAVYPMAKALELAEGWARGGALCVLPSSQGVVTQWIVRTNAKCLIDSGVVPQLRPIPPEAKSILDKTLLFGGHNGWAGGYEKERLIRGLREVRELWPDASPTDIEAYMLSTGETRARGAARAAKWYRSVIEGRGFLGERGRPI